jgi:hypothetical protein
VAIITVSDLKTWLSISDSVDDTNLTTAVNAANSAVVAYCGRNFDDAGTATARVFTPDDRYTLVCDDFHTTTGLVVKTDDNDDGTFETTWASTDYQLEPLNGRVGTVTVPYTRIVALSTRTWPGPSRRALVQVTAQWGWASLPADVKEAALVKASRLFKRKDSPEGVLGGFADLGAVRVSAREDPDVMLLLRPYRRQAVAAPVL